MIFNNEYTLHPLSCSGRRYALSFRSDGVRTAIGRGVLFCVDQTATCWGYAQTFVGKGQQFETRSKAWFKLAMLGDQKIIKIQSKTQFDGESPNTFRMTQANNDVVQVIETEFADDQAQTWSYRQGDPRGEPVSVKMTDNARVMGANDFSHFRLLAYDLSKSTGDEVDVSFFVPGAPSLAPLVFRRDEPQEVAVLGKTRNCNVWSVPKAGMVLYVDAKSAELIQIDLKTQKTLITLNNERIVKQAEKAQAEEVPCSTLCRIGRAVRQFHECHRLNGGNRRECNWIWRR